jgi:hypothetical protein
MPKYYVTSGQMKFIIDSADEISAILATFRHYKGKGKMPAPTVCVSEHGFDHSENLTCYDTDKYMKQA